MLSDIEPARGRIHKSAPVVATILGCRGGRASSPPLHQVSKFGHAELFASPAKWASARSWF